MGPATVDVTVTRANENSFVLNTNALEVVAGSTTSLQMDGRDTDYCYGEGPAETHINTSFSYAWTLPGNQKRAMIPANRLSIRPRHMIQRGRTATRLRASSRTQAQYPTIAAAKSRTSP